MDIVNSPLLTVHLKSWPNTKFADRFNRRSSFLPYTEFHPSFFSNLKSSKCTRRPNTKSFDFYSAKKWDNNKGKQRGTFKFRSLSPALNSTFEKFHNVLSIMSFQLGDMESDHYELHLIFNRIQHLCFSAKEDLVQLCQSWYLKKSWIAQNHGPSCWQFSE